MHSLLLVCFLLCLHPTEFVASEAKKILFISPFGTKSHSLTMMILAKEMQKKGYETEMLTSFKFSDSKVKILQTPTVGQHFSNGFQISPYGDPKWNQFPLFWFGFVEMLKEACSLMYKEPVVAELIKSKRRYSAIVMDSLVQECAIPLAYRMDAPIVFFSANFPDPSMNWIQTRGGSYSYVPFFLAPLTSDMNVLQRANNIWHQLLYQGINRWLYYPGVEGIAKDYLGHVPSIVDIISNVTMVMAAVDGIISEPQPLLPNTVDVGGITSMEGGSLPADLEKILNAISDDGFILFSLGSIVHDDYFPPEVQKSFSEAFSRLPQTIFWKGSPIPNLPHNVHIFNWLPQQDLLAHPKIRLFITHGGIHSLYEAAYHEVPVIGMGIFLDQKPNLFRASKLGIAIALIEGNITTESLYSAITQVLNDKRFYKKAKDLSVLLKDQLETPLQRAISAIELVARHGYLPHLDNAGVRLNLIQYFYIDMLIFVISIISMGFVILSWLTFYALTMLLDIYISKYK